MLLLLLLLLLLLVLLLLLLVWGGVGIEGGSGVKWVCVCVGGGVARDRGVVVV